MWILGLKGLSPPKTPYEDAELRSPGLISGTLQTLFHFTVYKYQTIGNRLQASSPWGNCEHRRSHMAKL